MRLGTSAGEILKIVEGAQLKTNIPRFEPGDTVRLQLKVPEGDKERIQYFEGVVIGRRGGGTREMVTVRKMSFGVGVERSVPLHSPFLSRVEVVRKGKARRAKLYYLREKTGKAAKLKQEYEDEGAVATQQALVSEPAAEVKTPEKKAEGHKPVERKAKAEGKKEATKTE